jgi:hypothetical protein
MISGGNKLSCMVTCLQGGSVPAIVERLLGGLLPALQSGEEAGTLHARRLTTALQARPPLPITSRTPQGTVI